MVEQLGRAADQGKNDDVDHDLRSSPWWLCCEMSGGCRPEYSHRLLADPAWTGPKVPFARQHCREMRKKRRAQAPATLATGPDAIPGLLESHGFARVSDVVDISLRHVVFLVQWCGRQDDHDEKRRDRRSRGRTAGLPVS